MVKILMSIELNKLSCIISSWVNSYKHYQVYKERLRKRLHKKRKEEPSVLFTVITDEQIRIRIIDAARSTKSNLRTLVQARMGDPYFETLPDVLREAPRDVDVKIMLIIPDEGFIEDDPRLEIIQEMLTQTRIRNTGGGNTEIRTTTVSEAQKIQFQFPPTRDDTSTD